MRGARALLGQVWRSAADALLGRPSGAGSPPWLPVLARRRCTRGSGSPELYEAILDQFDVEANPRYRRNAQGRDETYCNIFVWDVTRAMGAEIPHWVDDRGEPARPPHASETDANAAIDWLHAHGRRGGWRTVAIDEAQANANRGEPTVVAWRHAPGIGHLAMVRPGATTEEGPLVADAGETNHARARASQVFVTGWQRDDLVYFAHGDGPAVVDCAAPAEAPHWVANVRRPSKTLPETLARMVRRVHRLLTTSFVVVLALGLAWSWLGPMGDSTLALRISCTLAALLVAPIVLLRWIDPPTTAFMRRARRELRGADGRPRPVAHEFVAIDRIAKPMLLAVIVSEDPYFFWHAGFDPIGLWSAFQYNRKEREPGRNLRGGSTLSQQVAKNLFLSPAQSYLRKIVEAFLTLTIEGLWTKRRILEIYLNIVELGDGIFGVEAAARHFYGRPAQDLVPDEAALLSAALRAPRTHRVDDPSPAMLEAQAETLRRMAWCGEAMLKQLD